MNVIGNLFDLIRELDIKCFFLYFKILLCKLEGKKSSTLKKTSDEENIDK